MKILLSAIVDLYRYQIANHMNKSLIFLICTFSLVSGCVPQQIIELASTSVAEGEMQDLSGSTPTPIPVTKQVDNTMKLSLVDPALQELADWLILKRQSDEPITNVQISLAEKLKHEHYLSPEYEKWYEQRGEQLLVVTDLDGDNIDEWILTILMKSIKMPLCTTISCNQMGEIWVIGKQGLLYRLYNEDFEWMKAPVIIAQVDLTGDGLPEVITQSELSGAHTVTVTYHVISGHNGKVSNIILLGNEFDLATRPFRPTPLNSTNLQDWSLLTGWSSPGIELTNASLSVKSDNNDGFSDLVIDGGYFGSIGAGYYRGRIETWSWDGYAITLSDMIWQDSSLRVHALIDADYSFALQDYETATSVYQKVIFDDTLSDEVLSYSAEDMNPITRQYAAFRLVLVSLIDQNIEDATTWQRWLKEQFPDSPIVGASEMLINNYHSSSDLSEGCRVAIRFLSTNRGWSTWPLGSIGYGNPEISERTLCPIQ